MTGNERNEVAEVVYLILALLMSSTIAVTAGVVAGVWYGG